MKSWVSNRIMAAEAHRKALTLTDLQIMMLDGAAPRTWSEGVVWTDGGVFCLRCGECAKYFSVKTGTAI